MEARTFDFGPYVAELRGFGPPEVEPLADILGNGTATEKASLFWEDVEAVTFTLATSATVANRRPRLEWFAGESKPFAATVAPFTIAATQTVIVSFVRDVQEAGANNGPVIIGVLPRLMLLPGWSLALTVDNGVAGDHVTGIRVYRRRLEVVEIPAVTDDTLGVKPE